MDSGTSGSPFSVPSVCEGSKFIGLGEVQGFKSKLQNFIPFMEFITVWNHSFISIFTGFQQKLSSEQNLLKNQTSLFSKRFLGFVHLLEWIPIKLVKFPKYKIFYL